LWTALFELSLGLIAYLGAWSSFDPDDPLALYGAALIGSFFVIFAMGSAIVVVADVLRRRQLDRLSRSQLENRLRRETPSHRYVAKRSHVRGMEIGALFFGGLCVFAIGVRLLSIAGVIQIPQ
jgi:hypothetical protein